MQIDTRPYFPMFEEMLSALQDVEVRAIAVVALTTDPEMRYLEGEYGCGAYELKECASVLELYAGEEFRREQEDSEEDEEDG